METAQRLLMFTTQRTPVYTNSSSIFTFAVIKNYYGISFSPNVPMRITGMSMSAEDDLTQISDKVG